MSAAADRKLQDVKDRLDELKDLVQYYQSGNQFIHGTDDSQAGAGAGARADGDTEDQSSLPMLSDYEDPQLMKNLRSGEFSITLLYSAQHRAGVIKK